MPGESLPDPWEDDVSEFEDSELAEHDMPPFAPLEAYSAEFGEIGRGIEMEICEQEHRIEPTPYVCKDPTKLPKRQWLYGRQLLRGSLSEDVALGGIGKTALSVGESLAMVSGRNLLNKEVWYGPHRAWLYNLEDSGLELSYLIEAARLHWGITDSDIGDRLFVDSGLDGPELTVAIEDQAGFRILEPVIRALVEALKRRRIDVLIVDPFVSCHRVSENSNSAIDAIAKKWARVAVEADCAVRLVHHTRKLNGTEATAESGRGASALLNAARSVRALNRMSDEEARSWGIEGEKRRQYFRTYDDKANRAPPAARCDWYYLASIDLGNGGTEHGDSIQVVLPWTPPDAFTGVTSDHLRRVQDSISHGAWRESCQASNWAGIPVAEVLGLELEGKAAKARVKELLKAWLASGALTVEKIKDGKGREQPHIRVGNWAQPEGPTP